jgi:hypothetical protein
MGVSNQEHPSSGRKEGRSADRWGSVLEGEPRGGSAARATRTRAVASDLRVLELAEDLEHLEVFLLFRLLEYVA